MPMLGSGVWRGTTLVALSVALGPSACGQSTRSEPPRVPEPDIPTVALEGATTKSGERLRSVYFESDSGLVVRTGRFLDTERDEECSFGPAGSPVQHCYPDVARSTGVFQLYDADCRTRVFPACHRYAVPESETTCDGATLDIHSLGDVIEGPPRDAACSISTRVAPGESHRRIGARIPDSVFVRATLSVSSPEGSRIGTRQLSAEDGSAVQEGFFDRDEGSSCGSFWIGNSDERYCVPSPVGSVTDYFLDRACSGESHRIIRALCRNVSVGFSAQEAALYRVGRFVGTVPSYYRVGDVGCATSEPLLGYELGEQVELTDYAPVEQRRAGDGRLRTYEETSSDARAVIPSGQFRSDPWLWDEELGVQCSIVVSSDGDYRCVPLLRGTSLTGSFADDQCEVPLAAKVSGNEDRTEPNWAVARTPSDTLDCPYELSAIVHELATEPFTGTQYYASADADGNTTCVELQLVADQETFVLGAEVPPSRFVRFARKIE